MDAAIFLTAFTQDKIKSAKKFLNDSAKQTNKFPNPEKNLFENKRYQECTLYIQSINEFYTEHYITYLLKAFVSMGEYSSVRAAKDLYISSKTGDSDKEKALKFTNGVVESAQIDEQYMAEKILDSNLIFLDSNYEVDKGYMVAKNKVGLGETILVEEPFASVGSSKCSHCFRDSAISKCCKECNNIYYCSEDCQSDDKTFHQLECKLYNNKLTCPITKLAFRVFLKQLKSDFKEDTSFVKNNENISSIPKYYNGLLEECVCITTYILEETKLKQLIMATNKFTKLPESAFNEELFGVILELLAICKYNSVYIFDNVLGITNEIYSTLSAFKFSCDPNTIISRTGNKIILKTCKEIQIGEQITCNYFDMVHTTLLDVLLTDLVQVSILTQRCDYFCQCKKCPYTCISTSTNSIDDDSKFQQLLPTHNKSMLLIIKSNITTYLTKRDTELLYSTFNLVKDVILNKNHLLYQGIYFLVISQEISLDNFDNLHEYLPIIMNTKDIQFFKKSHMELCSQLTHRMESIFTIVKLPRSTIEVLIQYLQFLEENVYPRYPNEILLNNVKIMKSFFMFTKEYQLNSNITFKAVVA